MKTAVFYSSRNVFSRYPVFLILLLLSCCTVTCKKEKLNGINSPEIVLFVFNKGLVSTINKAKREVVVTSPEYIDRTALVAVFQLTDGAIAKVNGVDQYSSESINNFSQPVKYTLSSKGGSTEWMVKVVSNSYDIGLGSTIEFQKRIVKDYDWYIPDNAFGCTASVLRWCHPLAFFNISPTESSIGKSSGPPYLKSVDIFYILNDRDVPWKLIPVPTKPDYSDVIECIDKGLPVIMNIDFRNVPLNQFENQHINRFWNLTDPGIPQGMGHYILIKGYIKVDGILYYETYDSFSRGEKYLTTGEWKGYNRYYNAEYIRQGALGGYGFPYYTIVGVVNNGVPMPVLKNELNTAQTKYVSEYNNAQWKYGF